MKRSGAGKQFVGYFLLFLALLLGAGYVHFPAGFPRPAFAEDQEKGENAEEGEEADAEDAAAAEAAAAAREKEIASAAAKVVLDGLEEKREAIRKQQEELKLQQDKLDALKEEIEEKVKELSTIRRQIEESLAKLTAKETEIERERRLEEEARIAGLVKLYSGMKPKNAAAIINNLSLDVSKKIFARMKGDKAAKILALVNSTTAAKITEVLAAKKRRNKE